MKTACVLATLAVALLAATGLSSALSINNERPVQVTQRNSGPRYDIGEVERARALLRESSSPAPPPAAPAEGPAHEGSQEDDTPAVGHIALRRIFLFPFVRPQASGPEEAPPESSSGREQEDASERAPRVPMMMAKPMWPFMMPVRPTPGQAGHSDERPHIMRHLLGGDEASRSPSGDMDRAANEREASQQPPAFDPIQMMMDMMHQAISSQLGREFAKDLTNSGSGGNKDSSNSSDNSPAESSDERPTLRDVLPMKPGSQNETREDIVEIEGRKYMRKTLINRHVGDNIVYMTRRLIFVPLNETTETTESQPASTASTTSEQPVTPAIESDERPSPSAVHRVGDGKPSPSGVSEAPPSSSSTASTTTSTTTTTTEQPSSSARPEGETSSMPAESSTSDTAPPSESSTSPPPAGEPRAAERLVEARSEPSSPAPKPADSDKEAAKSS